MKSLGIPIIKRYKRYVYLSEILGRLQDEVGTAFTFYNRHNKNAIKTGGRLIGFWSGARLLFPIIEATSSVIGKSKWDFLKQDLGVKPSSLTWQMFRNSLLHGDKLVYSKFNRKIVRWGLIMDKKQHNIGGRRIHIDLLTLYQDLKQFIVKEIAKQDKTKVDVQEGIDYSTETNTNAKEIINDIESL